MAIQLKCGQCNGLLQVEETGVTVLCPHCSSELTIPHSNEADSAATITQSGHRKKKSSKPDTLSTGKDDTVKNNFAFLDGESHDDSEPIDFADASADSNSPAASTPPSQKVNVIESSEAPTLIDSVIVPPKPLTTKKSKDKTKNSRGKKSSNAARSKPAHISHDSTAEETVSKRTFLLLAGYATAVTLALLYFLFMQKHHALESLPDLAPLKTTEYRHVPRDLELPPLHRLQLGDERKFGSVIVRPLKVTKDNVEFTHFENSDMTPLSPVGPTLKLWIEFEHTGDCPSFAPYDLRLMTKRAERSDAPTESLTNSFLCSAKDLHTRNHMVLNYFHSADSEWNLKDQNADQALDAGQKLTSYVACDPDDFEKLLQDDSLIWRIQFRKGVSPNGNGVTTLVDVEFNADDIQQAGAVAG